MIITFKELVQVAKAAPLLEGWGVTGSREKAVMAYLDKYERRDWGHLIEGDRELPCHEAGCSRHARVTQIKVNGVWWYAGFDRQALAMAAADAAAESAVPTVVSESAPKGWESVEGGAR